MLIKLMKGVASILNLAKYLYRSDRNNLFLSLSFLGILFWIPCLMHAGITEGHVLLLGDKHIYFFGDSHGVPTRDACKKQLGDFVEAIKESESFREGKKLYFLLEKPFVYFRNEENLDILRLDEVLQENNLENLVDAKDAEFRKVTGAAMDVFITRGRLAHRDVVYAEGCPTIENITFADIFDECGKIRAELKPFKNKLAPQFEKYRGIHGSRVSFYTRWESIKEYMKELKALLDKNNIDLKTKIWKFAYKTHLEWEENYMDHEWRRYQGEDLPPYSKKNIITDISRWISDIACDLMNLCLFKKIYEHPGTHIALAAGSSHIHGAMGPLYDVGATKKMYMSIHNTVEDYRLYKILSKKQILRVFTEEGYSFLEKYLPALAQGFDKVSSILESLRMYQICASAIPPEKDPEK